MCVRMKNVCVLMSVYASVGINLEKYREIIFHVMNNVRWRYTANKYNENQVSYFTYTIFVFNFISKI